MPIQDAALRFSTEDFAERERIEAWRELFGRTICAAEIEPLADATFRSNIVLRDLGGLGVASGYCSGARYWRPASLVAGDDLIFVVNHTGTDRANMLGREALVHAGEAVLVTMEAVGGVVNKAPTHFTTMRFPRAALAYALPDIHEAMVNPVRADHPALRLLLNYISMLEDPAAIRTAHQREAVVSNIHDLMALSLGATRDAKENIRQRGLAAARLRAIKAEIRERLLTETIDIPALAARHGITMRYLQLLFEKSGETCSEFMMLQRLVAAHRMLRDPANDRLSIADIALGSGFNDVSYFNRSFRRYFERTPSDVRNNTDDSVRSSRETALGS